MTSKSVSTRFHFNTNFSQLTRIVPRQQSVIITDEHIFESHEALLRNWRTIVLKPGEEFKVQATVDTIIEQLIEMEADRGTTLIGVGGGVVTDITGYVASVYMRGLSFGFVPTSLLAMVDASIGGKNGIDVDVYKNMVGTINQPSFLLYDLRFLNSLPEAEWRNGFAEIIKHACILDRAMFRQLQAASLDTYRKNKTKLAALIMRNAKIKTGIVKKDPFERSVRRLLNFGHTLGHALENQYELSHGQAISIGMTYACEISEELTGFAQTEKVVALLEQFGLPTYATFNHEQVFENLRMDKKREKKEIRYILLEEIGKGVVHEIGLKQLQRIISSL